MTYIISIETENPDYKTQQSNILEFMKKIYPEFLHEKINKLYERSGINYRYSCIPDYNLGSERVLYPNSENLEPFPNIDKRLDIYNKEAKKLTIKTIKKLFNTIEKEKITHLITVSCTGMYAPGLDLEIIEELELNNEMYRTSINFMGCYAAFHGIKQADYICKSDKNAVVLVVCVELCTLHFMKDLDMNCVTSNAIFGDGCASLIMTANKNLINEKTLEIKGFYSKIITSGKMDMGWNITSTAFKMILTEAIPNLIKNNIREVIDNILKKFDSNIESINKWAIHPGGKKIVDNFVLEMNLERDKLTNSYDVLERYGNMSSPTVLFVLKDLIDTVDFNEKNNIFSCAFGPGITIESMLLSTCSNY